MILKNYSVLVGFVSLMAALPASATTYSPTSLKVKMYRVLISTDPLCTNPIVLWAPATPTVVDFVAAPTLGNGQVPDGNYPCMIWEMSDYVTMTAPTTSGQCVAGTVYTQQICRTGSSSKSIAGVTTNCVTGVEDKITLYLSTASTAAAQNSFFPPTSIGDTNNGLNLTAPLIVSGDQTGTLIFNGAGCLDDTQGCSGGQGPQMGFR